MFFKKKKNRKILEVYIINVISVEWDYKCFKFSFSLFVFSNFLQYKFLSLISELKNPTKNKVDITRLCPMHFMIKCFGTAHSALVWICSCLSLAGRGARQPQAGRPSWDHEQTLVLLSRIWNEALQDCRNYSKPCL